MRWREYMLRKGISKGKLMSEINMIIKRCKINAGKIIYTFIAHNHHAHRLSFTNWPPPATEEDDMFTLTAVERTLEMLNSTATSPDCLGSERGLRLGS